MFLNYVPIYWILQQYNSDSSDSFSHVSTGNFYLDLFLLFLKILIIMIFFHFLLRSLYKFLD